MSLKGRKALVTGGTRGIGRGVAVRLEAAGAAVTVTGSSADAVAPSGCKLLVADFRDPDAIDALAAQVRSLAPDILVNSAGINLVQPVLDIRSEDFEAIHRVNVLAPFSLCQAALAHMVAQEWGRIVNICSVWGKIGKELRVSYSASKFALAGMTSAMAAEVANKGVLANCVSPGPIDTEMTRKNLSPAMLADLLKSVPAGRLGTIDEVAALVVWLAGPENTFVVGQNIAIDGGLTRV